MQTLTDDFLDNCPIENGFRLRGAEMTRIEVFVDAAFAFAVTMLVISIDQIPRSVGELIEISKLIPGFVLSVMQLVFIWYGHNKWSRKFGLEDGVTIILSTTLVVVVLVFMYPLKMIFQGMFSWLTSNYLPSEFTLQSFDDLRILFQYFAAGFFMIGLLFSCLYAHAIKKQKQLKLSEFELYSAKTELYLRVDIMVVCAIAFVAPMVVPDRWVPWTGFCYALLGPTSYIIGNRREKLWNAINH